VGGLPKNVQESLPYLNKACDQNNSIACMRLFHLYINEKDNDLKRDPVIAYEYAKRACALNDILGCYNAARQCFLGILA